MNVSGYNVATENLNSVINESLKLVGKRLAQPPTRKTIDNILTEKVVVSNIQVGREGFHLIQISIYQLLQIFHLPVS
jgi:hypothetical protein